MYTADKIRLQHIFEEAEEIIRFVGNSSFDDFVKDSKTVHAVIRSIEIIGEAAAKISQDCKNQHPSIPWIYIIGMRNHLIHVYFDVDYQTIWNTVKNDIPMLIQTIEPLCRKP